MIYDLITIHAGESGDVLFPPSFSLSVSLWPTTAALPPTLRFPVFCRIPFFLSLLHSITKTLRHSGTSFLT
jgi:hypothetical protein